MLAVALMIGVGWLWMRWPSRPPGLCLAGRGVSLMLVMVMGLSSRVIWSIAVTASTHPSLTCLGSH
jgi:hypothetical protein